MTKSDPALNRAAEPPVSFLCPGTDEKPTHDCTDEAVAAIHAALTDPPTVVALVDGAESAPPRRRRRYTLSKVRELVAQTPLRTQVSCRKCSTVSIFSDSLLRDPDIDSANPEILLMLPTPGDDALAEAAKGISGLGALKASTANAAFVIANLALLTTLVTTLGITKTEEIGEKVVSGGNAVLLAIAAVFALLAIYSALRALTVTTAELRPANLEAVRTLINEEVKTRAKWSRRSVNWLLAAAAAVLAPFVWTLVVGDPSDDDPKASLSVMVDPGSRDVAVEASWEAAPADSRLFLQVASEEEGILGQESSPTKDGTAEAKRTVRIPAGYGLTTIETRLRDSKGEDVDGALERVCLSAPAVGGLNTVDCP